MSYLVNGPYTAGIPSGSSGVSYNNAVSGLDSTNVQDAIDELASDSVVELYSATSRNTIMSLNDSFKNYDLIVLVCTEDANGIIYHYSSIYYTKHINIDDRLGCSNDAQYYWTKVLNDNELEQVLTSNARNYISSIIGIKN